MNWTPEGLAPLDGLTWSRLAEFLARRVPEGQHLDYKQALSPSVIDCAVAMANSGGGVILIGIEENRPAGDDTPGAISGVGQSAPRRLENMLVDSVHPDLARQQFAVEDAASGKRVLVLAVPPSSRPPHYVASRGVLVRTGQRTRHATILEMRAWFQGEPAVLPGEAAFRRSDGLLPPLGAPGIGLAVFPTVFVEPRRFTYATDGIVTELAHVLFGIGADGELANHELRLERIDSRHTLMLAVAEECYMRLLLQARWPDDRNQQAVIRATLGELLEILARELTFAQATCDRVFNYYGSFRIEVQVSDRRGWALDAPKATGVALPHEPAPFTAEDLEMRTQRHAFFAIEAAPDDPVGVGSEIVLAVLRHLRWQHVEPVVEHVKRPISREARDWL